MVRAAPYGDYVIGLPARWWFECMCVTRRRVLYKTCRLSTGSDGLAVDLNYSIVLDSHSSVVREA